MNPLIVMNNRDILSALPQTALVIAEVIGVSSTLALAASCYERRHFYKTDSSVNVSVPKTIGRDHWIMKTLGRVKARKLSLVFGGEKLPLAKCKSISRLKRNEEILALKGKGVSVEEIRERFSMSPRAVMRVLDPLEAERNRIKTRERKRQRKAVK